MRPNLANHEFKPQCPLQAVDDRHNNRAHKERLCVHRDCHLYVYSTHCRIVVIKIHAHRSIAAACFQPSDLIRQRKTGSVHHSYHGLLQDYVVYNKQLPWQGIPPSTGTVGNSYDNALAEKF